MPTRALAFPAVSLAVALALAACSPSEAPVPGASEAAPTCAPNPGMQVTGTVHTCAEFASAHVAARRVDVWLPPSYAADPTRRFPVLYMHDGQNLFDPALSYTGIDWDVDGAITRLAAAGEIREAIVVGVWNTPRRLYEYMPTAPIADLLPPAGADGMPPPGVDLPVSDAYLRFLAEELKPFVDAGYRSLPGPADTLVMGSSMGGLISLYALAEYPGVFGAAGETRKDLKNMLSELAFFMSRRAPAYGISLADAPIWSHGKDFDPKVLQAAYDAVGQRVPWNFRHSMDTRTAFRLAGVEYKGKAHTPLEDCLAQCAAVCEAISRLGLGAGLAAGVFAALSIAIGMETAPYVAVAGAGAALLFLVSGPSRAPLAQGFGIAFFSVTALSFIGLVHPAAWARARTCAMAASDFCRSAPTAPSKAKAMSLGPT